MNFGLSTIAYRAYSLTWPASMLININGELDPLSLKICFCLSRVANRAYSLTWPAYMLINMSKRKFLHEKRVQSPLGCLKVHQHGCRFIVLEHQLTWLPWRHANTLWMIWKHIFLSLWLKGLVTEVKILFF